MAFDYETDPHAIERESFRRIRALSSLEAFSPDQTQVAMRLIHTCGEPSIAEYVRFSDNAVVAGCESLAQRAPVLCDVEMVRHGLTQRLLQNPAHCFLREPAVAETARACGETRTMAALQHWQPHLAGSIAVIGNAPTALFRLLEMLEAGCPKPALIIGMPVGFVGAAESKDALWQYHQRLGVACITLLGRWGGSALAASACNALLRINAGERY